VGIAVALLRPLTQNARRIGLDPAELRRAMGFDDGSPDDAFVSNARVEQVLAQMGRHLGDPVIGTNLARASPLGSLGTFDYAVWASATLREAIARSVRIYAFVCRGVSLVLEQDGDLATLEIRSAEPGGAASTVLVDFTLALHVVRIRETLDDSIRPRAVRVRHAPTDPESALEFFGVKTSFGQQRDELAFDARLLDAEMRASDPRTAALLEAHAFDSIAKMRAGDPLLESVRAAIAARLDRGDGEVDLAHAASDVGQSERTLQRQLQTRRTSLRKLVDDVRRDIAVERLADASTSTVEIARDLGFATPQAFYRAFQRWTGMTPAQFRAARGGEAG
jgi:AraC-like DNA-binding protein